MTGDTRGGQAGPADRTRASLRRPALSTAGMKLIEDTTTLQQIIERNSTSPKEVHATFKA